MVNAAYRATLIQAGFPSSNKLAGAAKASWGKKFGPSMATTTRPVRICKSPANLQEAPAANNANTPHKLAKAPTMVDIWAFHVSSIYKAALGSAMLV